MTAGEKRQAGDEPHRAAVAHFEPAGRTCSRNAGCSETRLMQAHPVLPGAGQCMRHAGSTDQSDSSSAQHIRRQD